MERTCPFHLLLILSESNCMVDKLNNLEREDINKFLISYLSSIPGFNGITKDSNDISAAVFLTSEGEELLTSINSNIALALNNFIENVLELKCKTINRNITFYESEIQPTSLILRWI